MIGVLDTINGLSSPTSNFSWGIVALRKAAIPAKANASNRLPSSETANKSRITCHAFSPGMIQRSEVSIHPDSLIPRSTTRLSSIDSALGGPASCCLPATGLTSAMHINPPSFGRSE